MPEQERLSDEKPEELEPQAKQTVWVVVSRHMDDPHPRCEGVFKSKHDANKKMKDCADTFSEPRNAIAWSKFEMVVE